MNIDQHIENLSCKGYTIVPGVIKVEDLKRMQEDFENQIVTYEQDFNSEKINENELGTIRCIVARSRVYDRLFDVDEVTTIATRILGQFIHYSFNGFYTSSMFTHPTTLFHRDVPVWTGEVSLSVNCLYMLDDCNSLNGATWLLPGSHLFEARPSDEYIDRNKIQVDAAAGSVLMFQSNLFHASGINSTNSNRKCIANVLRRSFMKSQFDWETVLSKSQLEEISAKSRDLLGLAAAPAKSIEDYYREGIRRREDRKNRGITTYLGIEKK